LEYALRDVELICSLAMRNGHAYPKEELDRLWKLLLLNQFHDVLPGSSIEMVYRDSDANYLDIEKSGKLLYIFNYSRFII
jgi:alpha-mannosidase